MNYLTLYAAAFALVLVLYLRRHRRLITARHEHTVVTEPAHEARNGGRGAQRCRSRSDLPPHRGRQWRRHHAIPIARLKMTPQRPEVGD